MIPSTCAGLRRSLMMVTGIFQSAGGLAAVNRLVIHALGKAGYQIDLYVLNEIDSEPDTRYIDPAIVACRGFQGNKPAYALAVWWSVLKTRYDLIIVDHVNVASVLAPLSMLGIGHYVVWLCGVEVFPPRPDFEGRIGLKHAWRRLAISDFTRQSVQTGFSDLPIEVCELST